MKRLPNFVYGVACYTASLATLLYCVYFLGTPWVPASLDSTHAVPWSTAMPIDAALVTRLGLQHSLMA
jgi:hypothetical protein